MKESLALKYRPRRFSDIVGQDVTVKILKNMLSKSAIYSGYIFSGQRGQGKTTTVRILAKAIMCQTKGIDQEPCNECMSCKAIDSGEGGDYIELDGASSGGIEAIRKLREDAQFAPQVGNHKIFMIDECHAISSQAFQALLKILEEAPEHVVFMFATTEFYKVPETIQSRCQIFPLNRIMPPQMVARLEHIANTEKIPFSPEALELIAKQSDGSMRDAITVLEQAYHYSSGKIELPQVREILGLEDEEAYIQLLGSVTTNNRKEVISQLNSLYRKGTVPLQVIQRLMSLAGEKVRQSFKANNEDVNWLHTFNKLTGIYTQLKQSSTLSEYILEVGLLSLNITTLSPAQEQESEVLTKESLADLFSPGS